MDNPFVFSDQAGTFRTLHVWPNYGNFGFTIGIRHLVHGNIAEDISLSDDDCEVLMNMLYERLSGGDGSDG